MSGGKGGFPKRIVRFLTYAYKTLVLYFLFCAVLLFSVHSGSWFNYFMVFLILSCPVVLASVVRRLGWRREQTVSTDK